MTIRTKDFSATYQKIYNFFCTVAVKHGCNPNAAGLRKCLDLSVGKSLAWSKGQWPSADDLLKLHEKFGFSPLWLLSGEGDPWGKTPGESESPLLDDAAQTPTPAAVPILGFASCGITGWAGKMTYPLAVALPHGTDGMLAVMATGESMLPEGIGHGHICFCDPHIPPVAGECVYVETTDGRAALKAFVGRGEAAGHGTTAQEICLRGWLDKQGDEPQKDFYLRVSEAVVNTIAPVVYVKRRL